MDEVDDKILEKLNENARKSYREIARELNVSLTTVSNRIKKREDDVNN
jgi:Lrp/AsnC family transcriptional regulator, regulator for asnA, asnC and gidA